MTINIITFDQHQPQIIPERTEPVVKKLLRSLQKQKAYWPFFGGTPLRDSLLLFHFANMKLRTRISLMSLVSDGYIVQYGAIRYIYADLRLHTCATHTPI